MEKLFFESWESIGRTAAISVMAYVALIIILRLAGNRPLTQLNAFDFIVNVAVGSTLATVMLNKDVTLADGLIAFFMLIMLQLTINYLNWRFHQFGKIVKNEPVLLYFNGRFISRSMKDNLISEEDLRQVVRSAGFNDPIEVNAIILENNGKFSVVKSELKQETFTL